MCESMHLYEYEQMSVKMLNQNVSDLQIHQRQVDNYQSYLYVSDTTVLVEIDVCKIIGEATICSPV